MKKSLPGVPGGTYEDGHCNAEAFWLGGLPPDIKTLDDAMIYLRRHYPDMNDAFYRGASDMFRELKFK